MKDMKCLKCGGECSKQHIKCISTKLNIRWHCEDCSYEFDDEKAKHLSERDFSAIID